MKLVHTILLIIAAGAMLAFILVVEREKLTTAEKQRKEVTLAMFRPGNINVIEMENAGAKLGLVLRDGGWKVREPFEDIADPAVVTEVLETLANVDVIRKERFNDGEERDQTFKEYGLDTDRQSVLLKGDGPQVKMIFGLETPSGESVYARLMPSSELAQIRKEIRDKAMREPDQFREPLLTRLEPKEVVEIRVRRPDGDMELELKDGFWHFRKPLQAMADNQVVFDTLRLLSTAKIEKFVANTQETAAEYGLKDPEGIIHLVLADGGKTVIKIGLETEDKKHVFASVNGRSGIFQVSDVCRAFVSLRPDRWRDRRILHMPVEAVTRIELQAAGKSTTVINRGSYGWMLELGEAPTPAQQSHVTSLLQWLSEARAEDFVSSGKSRLAEFGLDKPSLSIRLQALTPKDLNQKRVGLDPNPGRLIDEEWPKEAEFRFGKVEDGMVYLETPFQNSVVSIPAAPLAELPDAPFKWRTLALNGYPAHTFKWIEYRPIHKEKIRFERGEEGIWRSETGGADDRDRYVNEAVAALGKLRAMEFVTEGPLAEHGLDQPVLTVEFHRQGEDQTRRLKIGAPVENRGFFAQLEGLEAVFVLSGPDFDVLTLPLDTSLALPREEDAAQQVVAPPGN